MNDVFVFIGKFSVFLMGMILVGLVSVKVDQLLGIEIYGSNFAKTVHTVLIMAAGVFIVWLMKVTVWRRYYD